MIYDYIAEEAEEAERNDEYYFAWVADSAYLYFGDEPTEVSKEFYDWFTSVAIPSWEMNG